MNKTYKIGCVILAAGEGTRMKSSLPKVLFDVCGKTIIEHVIESVSKLDYLYRIYIVIGHKSEEVKQILISSHIYNKVKNKIIFVEQKKLLGSGDAVKQVQKHVDKNIKHLLVLSGDVPLISDSTLDELVNTHLTSGVDCTILSCIMDNPYGYGRIVRDLSKNVTEIVEEIDATEKQRSIKEVNAGIYVFKLPQLWQALAKIKPDNKKNEYYLTDTIKFVDTKNAVVCKNPHEVKGVNNRKDLYEITEIVRKKIIEQFMINGVSVIMPDTIFIDYYTEIGSDTTVLPGSIITKSKIGSNCKIGPYTILENVEVDSDTEIVYSYVQSANIGKNCKIGPLSRIRPQTKIFDNVSIGNFVEIKNSTIYNNTKINHLSYVGDAVVNEYVNIGAGSITCNFDGIKKHRTVIGKKVFIGSNVNLIAPINIGDNVVIAAGSTVTKDVPSNTFVIARAKEVHKINHRIVKRLFYSTSGEDDER